MKEANFKETEIGKIPVDWEVPQLGNYITLKNGFAFKSEYFSNEGPIVMTPGNFHLDGGLKFTPRNTIHFSGSVSENMKFEKGDLLMVMTDLTPSCNLLGKAGIVDTNEILLHNQRIGKIIFSKEKIATKFLYYFFNSSTFSNRMKSTATGSTVRHTSVPTIKNSFFPLPPLAEQKKIAEVLSDTDLWIESTEALLAKKRQIKKGAMQKLLSPKEDWEVRKLGEVCVFQNGLGHEQFESEFGKYIVVNSKFISTESRVKRFSHKNLVPLQKYDIVIVMSDIPNGKALAKCFYIDKNNLYTLNQRIGRISINDDFDSKFLFYLLNRNKYFLAFDGGSGQTNLRKQEVLDCPIHFPPLKTQQEIAEILSSMDLEIESLENRLQKARNIKHGMMQDLLTGKVRLV